MVDKNGKLLHRDDILLKDNKSFILLGFGYIIKENRRRKIAILKNIQNELLVFANQRALEKYELKRA